MNILETFYFLFKSDTTDLEKGSKRSQKTVNDLGEQLKNTQGQTTDLSIGFMDLASKAAEVAAAYIGIGTAIKTTFNAEEQSLELKRVADQFGLNAKEMAGWEYGMKQSGGTTQDFLGDLKALNSNLNNSTLIGGQLTGNIMTPYLRNLKVLGVDLSDGASGLKNWRQVYLAEADKMANMKPAVAANWSKQAGNSDATTRFLMTGRQAIEKKFQEGSEYADRMGDNGERIKQFAASWSELTSTVEGFAIVVAGPVVDALNAVLAPSDAMKDSLKDLGTAIKIVGAAVLLSIDLLFPALISSLFGVAVAVLAAAWPFLLLVGAIAAVWAVIHYGKAILKYMGDAFGEFFDFVENGFHKIGKLIDALFSGGSLKDRIAKFKAVWDEDDSGAKKPISNPAMKKGKDKGDSLPDAGDQSSNLSSHDIMMVAKSTVAAAATNPIGSQTGNSIINRNASQQNNIDIEKVEVITQATDADGMAGQFGASLSKHVNIAITNFDNGMKA